MMKQEMELVCKTLTLRDHFAAQALRYMIKEVYAGKMNYGVMAREAYKAADAMLAERRGETVADHRRGSPTRY